MKNGPIVPLPIFKKREPLGQSQKQKLPQWQFHFHKDKFVRTEVRAGEPAVLPGF